MAEGIFKKLIFDDEKLKNMIVSSAGTSVFFESGATEEAISAAADLGADIKEHKATGISADLINNRDLILTMTTSHKNKLLNLVPEAKNKIFTLKEFAGSTEGMDISDPYGCPLEQYKSCANEIYNNIIKVIEKIKGENR